MEVVMPLSVSTQLAKNEVKNTVSKIKESYRLPYFVLDGIFSEVLAEIRSEEQAEVSSDIMQMFLKKDNEGEEENGECRSKTEFVSRSE